MFSAGWQELVFKRESIYGVWSCVEMVHKLVLYNQLWNMSIS